MKEIKKQYSQAKKDENLANKYIPNDELKKDLLESFKKTFNEEIKEAKGEIDRGKLYHTQKFKFPFYIIKALFVKSIDLFILSVFIQRNFDG